MDIPPYIYSLAKLTQAPAAQTAVSRPDVWRSAPKKHYPGTPGQQRSSQIPRELLRTERVTSAGYVTRVPVADCSMMRVVLVQVFLFEHTLSSRLRSLLEVRAATSFS